MSDFLLLTVGGFRYQFGPRCGCQCERTQGLTLRLHKELICDGIYSVLAVYLPKKFACVGLKVA